MTLQASDSAGMPKGICLKLWGSRSYVFVLGLDKGWLAEFLSGQELVSQ